MNKRVIALMCACLIIALLALAFASQFTRPLSLADPNGIVISGLGEKLDEYFTSIAASDFSGVVFVVKDGQIVLSKGYGAANRKKRIPITAKTVFDIGSITKQFTAAAILKLEAQGRLRVTDLIGKYIRDVPPDKAGITIHHLLTHSAGFVNNFGQDDYAPLKRAEFIKLAMDSKLKFTPGEGFNYSNIGYSMLGAIIEIVTGQPYERYLHDNLFEPAGMDETGYRIPRWDADRVAIGYYRFGFAWGSPLEKAWDVDGPYWNLRAAAGMLSTADDLYKWHLALTGEKVLTGEAKEKFFKPHMAANHYGYGWVISKTPRGTTVIWHDGSNKIINAYFRRYVDDGVVVIIATNNEQHQAEQEIGKIDAVIFGSQ